MKLEFGNKSGFEFSLIPSHEEKMSILGEFKRGFDEFERFTQWMDRPDVPQEKKEPYMELLKKSTEELAALIEVLRRCGITDGEIKDITELPF